MKTGLIISFILISFFTGLLIIGSISSENKMALEIQNKDRLIQELNQRIDTLEEGISLREEEISYLGHQLDSLKEYEEEKQMWLDAATWADDRERRINEQ